ncbi:Uncharacterised protein [Mycobacteroides abscessus subsp. abscessus]|nr:Uncharacterised protein [Mycobacteroides abscessus subsp. abscessus]
MLDCYRGNFFFKITFFNGVQGALMAQQCHFILLFPCYPMKLCQIFSSFTHHNMVDRILENFPYRIGNFTMLHPRSPAVILQEVRA